MISPAGQTPEQLIAIASKFWDSGFWMHHASCKEPLQNEDLHHQLGPVRHGDPYKPYLPEEESHSAPRTKELDVPSPRSTEKHSGKPSGCIEDLMTRNKPCQGNLPMSHSPPPEVCCHICGRTDFKNEKGVKEHIRIKHKNHPNNQQVAAAVVTIVTDPLDVGIDFATILADWRKRVKLHQYVPKAARPSVAQGLTDVVEACVRENSRVSWRRLMAFAFGVFCQPDRKQKSPATLIKNNMIRVAAGDTTPAYFCTPRDRNENNSDSSDDKLRKRVEAKIKDGDISGAVRLLSSEDTLAEDNEETFQALLAKHPPERPGTIRPEAPTTAGVCEEVTAAEIRKAVFSFPKGSAGGTDGMRPQHLKDLLGGMQDEWQKKLAASLAALVTVMLAGDVHEDMCKHLYGGNVFAFNKKTGGIRPISVGSTIRRIAAKVLGYRTQELTGNLMRPTQIGCGTSGGAEAAIHATRAFMDEPSTTCRVLLELDFVNAFNTIHRDKLLAAVKELSSSEYPFFRQVYGEPTILLYGDEVIISARGVHQGCPRGPAGFSYVLHLLSKELRSELKVCYLDDVTLGGDPQIVALDLQTVGSWKEESGLELNAGKCILHIMNCPDETEQDAVADKFRRILPGIRVAGREDMCLLGAPLTEEAIQPAMKAKTAAVERLTARLKLLQPHQAFFLLKNCLSIPKLMYMLRSCPVWKRPDLLREFDEVMRVSLATITNTTMVLVRWLRATLPVRCGGLGIRLTEELALPAYLASVNSVQALITEILPSFDLAESTDKARTSWEHITLSECPEEDARAVQKEWDEPIVKRQLNDVYELVKHDEKSLAHFLAVTSAEAGLWLNALPSPVFGNLLDGDTLRISIALRLGAEVCLEHKCRCGKVVDRLGHHGLCCLKSAGRFPRHTSLNGVVCRGLVSSGMPARTEPVGLTVGNNLQPDGVTMCPYCSGYMMIWDVTCPDTLAPTYVSHSASNPGYAAARAEEAKRVKYTALMGNYIFYPVAIETFGPWGPSAKKLIGEIGKRLIEKTGDKRAAEFFRQRISIEMQRGNALSVLGTTPRMRGLEGVFTVLGKCSN